MTVRVRLAPSPTGHLHIGTARTALFNWLYARKRHGVFLLRIEDTDKERSKVEFTKNILEGLQWLGLSWDEQPVLQSERIDEHRKAIISLLEKGLAYRCYATEAELQVMRDAQAKAGEAPHYDNRHRNLTSEEEAKFIQEGRTSVIRFRIDEKATITWNDIIRGPMQWNSKDLGGDMVISRRAPANEIGNPLYNLVVVIDDAEMKISHVIRGEDHLSNTAKQILLYQALDLPQPVFAHTPLILSPEGKKLSKRDGVTSITDFRKMGYTSNALTNYMTLLGWSPPDGMEERFNLKESSLVFDFDRVNKAGAKFDWDKLNWLNAQEIHGWAPEKLLEELKSIWISEGWILPDKEWGLKLAKLIGPSLTLVNDGLKESRIFFDEPSLQPDGMKQLEMEGAKEVLSHISKKIEQDKWDGLNDDIAKNLISDCAKSLGVKKGLIMKSLRAALMGTLKGPDLISSWSLLAMQSKDLPRLKKVIY